MNIALLLRTAALGGLTVLLAQPALAANTTASTHNLSFHMFPDSTTRTCYLVPAKAVLICASNSASSVSLKPA